MDINQLLSLINSPKIIYFAFKIFATFFAIFYLLYAVVLARQTRVMINTLETKNKKIFFTISSLQIAAGLILLVLAIFLL